MILMISLFNHSFWFYYANKICSYVATLNKRSQISRNQTIWIFLTFISIIPNANGSDEQFIWYKTTIWQKCHHFEKPILMDGSMNLIFIKPTSFNIHPFTLEKVNASVRRHMNPMHWWLFYVELFEIVC